MASSLRFTLALLTLQSVICLSYGMCDQRPHGDLKCCGVKDSNCFVKVQSNRTRGVTNTICYCDRYCKFTNDCCEDAEKVMKLCNQPRDCEVSPWEKWGACSAKCGFGTMKRKRKITQYPENGGKKCLPLKQTRGCNLNSICDKQQYETAFLLPITFRRPKVSFYENILPAEKLNNPVANVQKAPTNSYCVHYKVTFKRKNCAGTWANVEEHIPVCTECQSRAMDGGRCRGEGALGIRTRWKAIGLKRCHGDWVRLGPIIPNCTCGEKQFTNFVFV